MIYEANASSSACRLWRIFQVETSTRPSGSYSIGNLPHVVKHGEIISASGTGGTPSTFYLVLAATKTITPMSSITPSTANRIFTQLLGYFPAISPVKPLITT